MRTQFKSVHLKTRFELVFVSRFPIRWQRRARKKHPHGKKPVFVRKIRNALSKFKVIQSTTLYQEIIKIRCLNSRHFCQVLEHLNVYIVFALLLCCLVACLPAAAAGLPLVCCCTLNSFFLFACSLRVYCLIFFSTVFISSPSVLKFGCCYFFPTRSRSVIVFRHTKHEHSIYIHTLYHVQHMYTQNIFVWLFARSFGRNESGVKM